MSTRNREHRFPVKVTVRIVIHEPDHAAARLVGGDIEWTQDAELVIRLDPSKVILPTGTKEGTP